MKYRPIPPFPQIRQFLIAIEAHGFLGAIADFFRRLFLSIKNRGFGGTLARLSPQVNAPRENAAPIGHTPFDQLHGTDTGGYIQGGAISAISLSGIYSTAYGGSPPSALIQALSALPIEFENTTFVDIGCGKGLALLVAAQFSFRQLLGVELASELCDIARANIAKNPDWAARISVANQDATRITYPAGPLVLYLYHPFLAPVLRRVLKNLERQLRDSPRPIYLLYALDPHYTQVIGSFPFLKEISETAYLLSPEDVVHNHFGRIEERFTLYSACTE